jgi:hypothetical protein
VTSAFINFNILYKFIGLLVRGVPVNKNTAFGCDFIKKSEIAIYLFEPLLDNFCASSIITQS